MPGADRGGARRRVHVAGGDPQDSQASTTADAPIADSAQRLAAAYAGAVSARGTESEPDAVAAVSAAGVEMSTVCEQSGLEPVG